MIALNKVLISDAVHESCVELLQENGINVICKLKLTEEQLINEIPVSVNVCLYNKNLIVYL